MQMPVKSQMQPSKQKQIGFKGRLITLMRKFYYRGQKNSKERQIGLTLRRPLQNLSNRLRHKNKQSLESYNNSRSSSSRIKTKIRKQSRMNWMKRGRHWREQRTKRSNARRVNKHQPLNTMKECANSQMSQMHSKSKVKVWKPRMPDSNRYLTRQKKRLLHVTCAHSDDQLGHLYHPLLRVINHLLFTKLF